MSSAAEILVIFLSCALAIFLVLGIILIVLMIKVTRQIGDAAENIESISTSINNAIQNISLITSPFIIGKTIFDIFNKKKKEKK